jgi:hypothetical protein
MDLTTLGFAMGSAWLSGINLYATVLTLGLLQKFHVAQLPGDLGYLGTNWVIALAAALYLVQFVADKVPAVDSVWDMVHTFIRVPAGAILAATAFGHFDPRIRILALLVGGGIALSSHGMKSVTRLAANTSPEPISNIGLSLFEDVLTVGGTILMTVHPAVLIGVVGIAVIVTVFLARWITRALRRRFGRRTSPTMA